MAIRDNKETHITDLKSRKALIWNDQYKIGFDGKEVWVAPNKMAYGEGKRSARFYHNLNFYFFAIPFVLADPGINYGVLPQDTIMGKMYDVLKIAYQDGVGDAPEDYYITYSDPDSHQLEWLLYTVTYYSGEKSDRFNCINYAEWKEVSGLVVPTKMIGYRYSDGQVGEKRYEKLFSDISFSKATLDQNQFEMPDVAEIDSLIQH